MNEKYAKNAAAELVVERLVEKGWHISFAESCTGGLAVAKIVDVPNASQVLNASFVTYAESAKIKLVGVSAEAIEKLGVVSEQVAAEMARGAALNAEAEVGVGITGIAGPSGGTSETPVGTVCFGFFVNGKVLAVTEHFGSIGRSAVRQRSVEFVFDTLCDLLK